jgi:DHA2 family multidrug resistance protein-like MFS transporter
VGLNIAVPELQRDFGLSATELLWVVDVYALVFAGLLLPAGALGDRFGRKGTLLVGLGLFAAGALAAGLSSTAVQVIAARAVMGVGAAFVMPAVNDLPLAGDAAPPESTMASAVACCR